MKRVLINVLVLACAVFTVTAQPTRHEVKVGNFSRLVVTADVNVDYRCNPDSAGLAVMYCEQSVADHFIFSINKNGRLNIQLDNAYQQLEYLPKVTVYSSSLEEAENASDSTLRIIGLPRMASFKVMLIDNGHFVAFMSNKFHHGEAAYKGYAMGWGDQKGSIVKLADDYTGHLEEGAVYPVLEAHARFRTGHQAAVPEQFLAQGRVRGHAVAVGQAAHVALRGGGKQQQRQQEEGYAAQENSHIRTGNR